MKNNCCGNSKRDMSFLAWPTLGLIAILSTGTIAWEAATPAVDGQEVVSVPSFQQTAPSKVPARKQVDDYSQWADATLARPLFSQNRRPLADNAVAAISVPYSLPRLTGVIVCPAGGFAIFASAAGGRPTIVRPGDRLGPAVVETIATGQVSLQGPNGLIVLRPGFQDTAIQMGGLDPGISEKPGYRPHREGRYSAFWRTVAANRPSSNQ